MIDFAISLYAVYLYFLYRVSPSSGDNSVFGFRKLTFLVAAAELPYLYTVSHNPDGLHPVIQTFITDFQLVFLKFLWLKALFLTAFTVTAFHRGRRTPARRPKTATAAPSIDLAPLDLQLSFVMLFLTVLTYALLLIHVGGLFELLTSWSIKTEVLRGTALYRLSNLVFGILAIGFFINYIGKKPRVTIPQRIFLALLIVIVFAVLLSVGERKNPVLVVIFSMVAWHFRVKPIKLITGRNLVLFVAFIGFAAIFPDLRRPDAVAAFLEDPLTMFLGSLGDWGQVFARVSDLDTSLFIYSYFHGLNDFWFGATWGDLFTGVIPSSLMPTKPPIDEGVYIYALAHNYSFHPPVPFRDLIPVGWPLSRVTGPFVQFGIVGVLVGGLMTGFLMRWLSKVTFRTLSPASLFIYTWAQLTGFGLTNAFIFNLALIMVLLTPIHLYYRAVERKRTRRAWKRALAA